MIDTGELQVAAMYARRGPHPTTGKGKRRGFIFVYGIVALSLLFIMGTLSLQVSIDNWNQSVRARANIEALNLAEAGADAAEAYLRSLSTPPAKGTTTYYPASGTRTLPTGSYYAVITTRTNPHNAWYANTYVVTAYGTASRVSITRKVIISLSPQSFTLYGYFEDSGLSNNWWVSDLSHFQGPFHTNGQLQIDWSKSSSTSIFDSTNVSSHSSSIKWGSAGTPKNATDWGKIFTNVPANGSTPMLTLKADTIPFPSTADQQKTAAWGSASGFPTTQGCYINTTNINAAGIYITSGGQNVTVTFSVDASGNQVVTINHYVIVGSTQTARITELTQNLVGNSTSMRTKTGTAAWTSPTVYTGVPNGVLYTDGAITGLSGTLGDSYVQNGKIVRANAWTVSTDFSSVGKKNVTITNNIKYLHPPVLTNPYDPYNLTNLTAPALGVLGYQIRLSTACPTNTEINGVYMATSPSTSGSILVDDIAAKKLRGDLTIMGGTIVKTAAILGQYSSSTKQLVYGFHETYKYDPRMADGPLRAFPQTNQYGLDSWQWQ
jgi:hypothetical protein